MRFLFILFLSAAPAAADMLVATRTIRPKEIIAPGDIVVAEGAFQGALSDPEAVIGQEARVAIYAGRPVRDGDIGPPALVERNAPVLLRYEVGGLSIATDGRALGRGAVGESIRAMNLSSRTTVTGRVLEDGSVLVGHGPANGDI